MTDLRDPIRGMSPRPFALHLTLAMGALLSSKAGLRPWSSDWPSLISPLPKAAGPELPAELERQLQQTDPAAFSAALNQEIGEALKQLAEGIAAYRAHPYKRPAEWAPTVWEAGSSALLDHGGVDGSVPALFVPSLINRGWVLDLMPGRGMLSALLGLGVHPFRLEWGAPGVDERGFGIKDYVEKRLVPALDRVRTLTGRKPVLIGYCMGGLLTLLAALRRPDLVSGLVLLAVPWDFHAEGAGRGKAMAQLYRMARPAVAAWGELPVDLIQGLFAAHDPIVALRKFRKFAQMDQAAAEAASFVALEDWLNHGVPLSLGVADEALFDWYETNAPGRLAWRPDGQTVDPAALKVPSLVVVPGADRIVPPSSAAAILQHLPNSKRLDPPLGHIGMVVGRRGGEMLWRPLAEWVLSVAAEGRLPRRRATH